MEANPAEGVLSKGPHVRTLRPLESRGLFWDPQRQGTRLAHVRSGQLHSEGSGHLRSKGNDFAEE